MRLSIEVGPRDKIGKRDVIADLNGTTFVHKFDVDDFEKRYGFAKLVGAKFGLPEEEYLQIPDHLVQLAEIEDDRVDLIKPDVVCMGDIEAMETKWFWPGYIPAGCMTMVDGIPGVGKSQYLTDLAARYSRGDCMPPHHAPDGTFTPRGVLMLSAEDDPAYTIKPRLDAAGADSSKVFLLRTMNYVDGDDEREIELPLDIDSIADVVKSHDIGLLTIDPITAHFGEKTNTNVDASVRRALRPLARMAEQTGLAVAMVRHLNKKEGQSAMNRGGGSIGIIAACRAAYIIGPDPADSGQVVVACSKMNLAKHPPSLAYTIVESGATSRVQWSGEVDISADELVSKPDGQAAKKIDQAKEIIAGILSAGTRGENEVQMACTEAGISKRTYWRARGELGVMSEKSDFDGQWMLTLSSANGACHEY